MLDTTAQQIGQNLHIHVGVSFETLSSFNDVLINHAQSTKTPVLQKSNEALEIGETM